MKDIQNIDELIKKGMEGFSPTPPPDAWNFIEKQVKGTSGGTSAEPSGGTGTQLIQAVKQMSLLGKIVAAVGLPMVGAGIYLVLNSEPQKTVTEVKPVTEQTAIQEVQEPEMEIKTQDLVQTEKAGGKLPETNKEKHPSIIDNSKPESNINSNQNPTNIAPAPDLVQPENNKVSGETKGITKTATQDANKNVPVIDHPKKSKEESNPSNNYYPEPELSNAFSPNGDGQNDSWEIILDNLSFYHLSIFDSRGNLVFETDQLSNFWNGTNAKSGMESEAGVYFYEIKYQHDKTDKMRTKNGIVTLVR